MGRERASDGDKSDSEAMGAVEALGTRFDAIAIEVMAMDIECGW